MGITEEEYREEHRRAIEVLAQFKDLEASFEMKRTRIDSKTLISKRVNINHKGKIQAQRHKADIDLVIVKDVLDLELFNEYGDGEFIIL